METLRRIAALTFRPGPEWDRIAGERPSVGTLLRCYILPLALLAPMATVIGMTAFGRDWDPAHGYLVPSDRIFATGAATYVAIVGSIFALAAIFFIIAPMFGGTRDFRASLKVATYGAVPLLVAGATMLLPVMAMVGLVGLCQSLFVLWQGARRVLNVRADAGAEFIGISVVLLTFVSALVGAGASAFGPR